MDVQRRRTRAPDPRSLDVAALARDGTRLEGEWPLAELARLRGLVLDDAGGDAGAEAEAEAEAGAVAEMAADAAADTGMASPVGAGTAAPAGAGGDGRADHIAWSATGSTRRVSGGEDGIWLALTAAAPVRMQCQRCLQPVAITLAVDRRLRFVRGEEEAARLDEESDDDVLELRPREDLRSLIEDELILALPLVPRHERCPEPLNAAEFGAASRSSSDAASDADTPPHPFADLAALRRRPS